MFLVSGAAAFLADDVFVRLRLQDAFWQFTKTLLATAVV